MHERIGTVADPLPPVAPGETCGDVYRRFRENEDLVALAVVDGGRPIGLVNRHDLLLRLAQDYGRALYAQKPITTLMDPAPLIVDCDLDVDVLQSFIAMQSPSALFRGFVVTQNDRYRGIGTALTLLKLTVLRTERRSRELEAARQEAVIASRSKSQFLANMSHELRTPLNAIIGFAEIIRDELYGPAGQPRYVEYAADILNSGQHLLSIINDILDMAKIEAGRMELHETWLNPLDAIRAAARIVAEQARIGGLDLVIEGDVAVPRLLADDRMVRQMLLNLLSNAIKFTKPGGRVTVCVAYAADGGFEFSVADTGIGMSEEEVARALTAFGQVDSELNRRHNGTGLGLNLVRSLIGLHQGRFAIDSAKGQGTRIALIFPAARAEPAERPAERARA